MAPNRVDEGRADSGVVPLATAELERLEMPGPSFDQAKWQLSAAVRHRPDTLKVARLCRSGMLGYWCAACRAIRDDEGRDPCPAELTTL